MKDNNPLTVGRLMAHVRCNLEKNPATRPGFDSELYQDMNNRLELILSSDHLFPIPDTACSRDQSFLKDHPEFFLLLIKEQDDEAGMDTYCVDLTHHLNRCYVCFEDYCHVMREYFHACQEICRV